ILQIFQKRISRKQQSQIQQSDNKNYTRDSYLTKSELLQKIGNLQNEIQKLRAQLTNITNKISTLENEKLQMKNDIEIPLVSTALKAHKTACVNFGEEKWINSVLFLHVKYLLTAVYTNLTSIRYPNTLIQFYGTLLSIGKSKLWNILR